MSVFLKLKRENDQLVFFLAFFLMFYFPAFSINNKYNADSIPDTLKINADAVIRDYTTILEVTSINYAKKSVHFAVTILNKSGEHFGIFNETYHKFLKVDNFSGAVYDATGNLVKELKKSDFKDLSAISGYTLFDDTRRKYLSPVTNFFPYTIEYDYEIHYDGLFYYPTWYPISSYNIACEKSNMEIILPKNMNFRYKVNNFKDSVSIIEQENRHVYSWRVANVQSFEYENFSQSLSQIVPNVLLAPNNFEIDGYYGNQQTWQNFGLWVKLLNSGRENLDYGTINEIKEEIGALDDTLSLIRKVYKYVQSRTRYVNLKLGIGGYQPIDAQTVHNVGYGDCKALTNYTKSILNIYGIQSYYTLVQAGSDAPDIVVDFPGAQFNHAFLSVPLKIDTIWLECTSQTNPFGYIGGFTDNRQVLLITSNGGKMVKTPDYNAKNLIKRAASIEIDEKGSAKAEILFIYQGIEYSKVADIFELSAAEQKKWIYDKLPFSSFTVNNFDMVNNKEGTVHASISLSVELDKYASLSNKRIFVPLLNFKNEDIQLQNISAKRYNDIFMKNTREIVDSIVFSYPPGYEIEYLPKNNNKETQFGNITIKINSVEQNKILIYSCINIENGLYDKKYFDQLVDFTEIVHKNNNSKAVLVKNNKPE